MVLLCGASSQGDNSFQNVLGLALQVCTHEKVPLMLVRCWQLRYRGGGSRLAFRLARAQQHQDVARPCYLVRVRQWVCYVGH